MFALLLDFFEQGVRFIDSRPQGDMLLGKLADLSAEFQQPLEAGILFWRGHRRIGHISECDHGRTGSNEADNRSKSGDFGSFEECFADLVLLATAIIFATGRTNQKASTQSKKLLDVNRKGIKALDAGACQGMSVGPDCPLHGAKNGCGLSHCQGCAGPGESQSGTRAAILLAGGQDNHGVDGIWRSLHGIQTKRVTFPFSAVARKVETPHHLAGRPSIKSSRLQPKSSIEVSQQ